NSPLAKIFLASRCTCAYFAAALFRTCLWPCVDRWASGQETGQPPRERPGSLTMRSTAGGETGAPRAQRGTRLKATTERASLVSAGLHHRRLPSRLVHPCRPCGTGNSPSKPRQLSGSRALAYRRVPIARQSELKTRITEGGSPPADPVGECPMTARIR